MNNSNKLNTVVIFGGKSPEHDVSCMSAYNILNAIDRDKYNVYMIGISKQGEWFYFDGDISKINDGTWKECAVPAGISPTEGFYKSADGVHTPIPCDVVFPAVHGGYCEDGRMQGLLDMCDIKYVGPGCTASAVGMDKFHTKLAASYIGVPVSDFYFTDRQSYEDGCENILRDICSKFSFPVFVKPANAGSSVGVSKATDRTQLSEAISTALKYDSRVLIEEYIKGSEVEVAVMGNDSPIASVCGEINPGANFYDYETKYESDTASYYIPARISQATSDKIRTMALGVYKILGCRGLSRVDFFVCDDESIVFNEINTLPGFTSISMYPTLFKHSGMTYSQIIDKLIELAVQA